MTIIEQSWSHKVNAAIELISLDGPDYWYQVRWQRRGGEGGERFHDRQQAQEFFNYMDTDKTPR
jgi:hypothetical protein